MIPIYSGFRKIEKSKNRPSDWGLFPNRPGGQPVDAAIRCEEKLTIKLQFYGGFPLISGTRSGAFYMHAADRDDVDDRAAHVAADGPTRRRRN